MKLLNLALILGLLLPPIPSISREKHGQAGPPERKKRQLLTQPQEQDQKSRPQKESPRPARQKYRKDSRHEASPAGRQNPAAGRPSHEGRGSLRILREPKERSILPAPVSGRGGMRLKHSPFPHRKFDAPLIRSHMGLVAARPWMKTVLRHNLAETQAGRYYWHSGSGFDYCHYYDPWGYHWYGWYVGDSYFWTRYHLNRWWWHDPEYGRWTFWWGGYWYWWDPLRIGVVYVYDNGNYVEAGGEVYKSEDGSRVVKVIGKDNDAFLYDSSKEGAFDPLFLASGVNAVKFIETESGRVAEVVLTLEDGTKKAFTDEGEELFN